MRSARNSAVLNTPASVSPRRRTTHSLKVIMYEWLSKTITMQFVYELCIAFKRGEFRGEQHVVRQRVPIESMRKWGR